MHYRTPLTLVVLVVATGLAALAQTPPAAQPASVPAAPADPNAWAIDTSHSAAHFAVRHMLVSTVRGQLGPVRGTVSYDGRNVSSIRAEVTIDVNGLTTGVANRDNHLRTPDFFDVPNHPTMTFKSTRVVAGVPGRFQLIGDLTIRGTTKEVTLDVEGPVPPITVRNVRRTAVAATTTLNRFDFGLRYNALIEAGGGAVVGDEVKVTIDLEATKR
jgi:polyisoprenoid-binding protein YceI